MRLLYICSDYIPLDFDGIVDHAKHEYDEYFKKELSKLDPLKQKIKECLNETNSSSNYVQLKKYQRSIKKLKSKISEHSTPCLQSDVEELKIKTSFLVKEIDVRQNEISQMAKTQYKQLEDLFLRQKLREDVELHAKQKYYAMKNLIKYYENKLMCQITVENDNIFTFQSTRFAKEVLLRFQNNESSPTLIETCPKLKVTSEMKKKFNSTADIHGLLAFYYTVLLKFYE